MSDLDLSRADPREGIARCQDVSASELLLRIRGGDRAAAAAFLSRYERQLQRRIRERLHARLRTIFDTGDVMGTVSRRFDAIVASGGVRAQSMGEVISLLQAMIRLAIASKARKEKPTASLQNEDESLMTTFWSAAAVESEDRLRLLERCFSVLPCDLDRDILQLWITGQPLASIAELLGVQAPRVRKRWELIRSRLGSMLTSGGS